MNAENRKKYLFFLRFSAFNAKCELQRKNAFAFKQKRFVSVFFKEGELPAPVNGFAVRGKAVERVCSSTARGNDIFRKYQQF